MNMKQFQPGPQKNRRFFGVEQELTKGLQASAYLICSGDDFLLYETLSIIRDKYSDAGALNFDIFDMNSPDDSKPVEQILDILNTLPFLSDRRLVIIENIQKLSKKDAGKIEGYISNPSPASLLIMLHKGTPQKLFSAQAPSTGSGQAVKNLKTLTLAVPEKDIGQWIKDRAKRKGIEITDRAAEYLISSAGADLGMLYAEIKKISFLGTKNIDIDEIKNIVYTGAEYSAFDLVNALKKKDAAAVFGIFQSARKNIEPQMLLGALNWQYANLQSKSHHKGERFFRMVFKLLHEADASVKTSRSYVIEDLFVKLLKVT
jgi:DNA polymerase-3 subunit delta